jgi:hypothetical protein
VGETTATRVSPLTDLTRQRQTRRPARRRAACAAQLQQA